MGSFFAPPKIQSAPTPTPPIPEASPTPDPKAKLDADLPHTEHEVAAVARSAQQAVAIKRRRLGVSGLTIPLTTHSGLSVVT